MNRIYTSTCSTSSTAGSPSAAGSCTFRLSQTPGTYQFRLFRGGTFTVLATSGTIVTH